MIDPHPYIDIIERYYDGCNTADVDLMLSTFTEGIRSEQLRGGGVPAIVRRCLGPDTGIIEEGVDILNPVQTSAANMDPVRLKREFGSAMTFWGGGCDTQSV